MKKTVLGLFLSTFIMLSMTLPNVFAGSLSVSDFLSRNTSSEQLKFEVTSGIARDVESTFDETRTFSGSALKDTVVTITIYTTDSEDTETLLTSQAYTFTVGGSGMYSQLVDLALGENYITVEATDGQNQSTKSTIIKRKNHGIKEELEQGIALPGQVSVTPKIPEVLLQVKVK